MSSLSANGSADEVDETGDGAATATGDAERLGETKLDPIGGGAAIAKSIVTVCLEEQLRRF